MLSQASGTAVGSNGGTNNGYANWAICRYWVKYGKRRSRLVWSNGWPFSQA